MPDHLEVLRVLRYLRQVPGLFVASLFFLFLLSALTAAKTWLVQPAVDAFVSSSVTNREFVVLCGVVAAIFVSQAILSWSCAVVSEMAGSRVVARIRQELFFHLMKQDLRFFSERSSSDLASRIVNDVSAFNYMAINSLQNLLLNIMTICLLISVMFYMDSQLAFLCLGIVVLVGIVLRATVRLVSAASERIQIILAEIVRQLSEMTSGIQVIISFGISEKWGARFRLINRKSYEAQVRAQQIASAARATSSAIVGLGISGILFLTGSKLLDGDISPGQFMTLLAAMYLLQAPMMGIGSEVTMIATGLAAVRRGFEIFGEAATILDPDKPVVLVRPHGQVRFDSVHFAYGKLPVLKGVSFSIEPGKLLVMLGDSGAGKSTVAKLMLRFYDPDSGQVLIDGVDIRNLSREQLYQMVTYVSQEVFLFDDSIRRNLGLGKPDASDAETAEAARIACVDEFLSDLPDGLETIVGERGIRLSGGQRQRIAIARAVLTRAPVLILDEATSALDIDLEQRILRNLVSSPKSRTIFAVTHRPSFAAVADHVLVLKDGRIAEEDYTQSPVSMLGVGPVRPDAWRVHSPMYPRGEQ